MEMRNAEILFRTGYFRVVYPLGCCLSCEQRQSHADVLPDHHRLHAGRNTEHVGSVPAGIAGEGSGETCEVSEPDTSWYRLTEEEQFPIANTNYH